MGKSEIRDKISKFIVNEPNPIGWIRLSTMKKQSMARQIGRNSREDTEHTQKTVIKPERPGGNDRCITTVHK